MKIVYTVCMFQGQNRGACLMSTDRKKRKKERQLKENLSKIKILKKKL